MCLNNLKRDLNYIIIHKNKYLSKNFMIMKIFEKSRKVNPYIFESIMLYSFFYVVMFFCQFNVFCNISRIY